MSQSAIWDALLIAGDALQDGRLEDCEGVLAELDEMEAWSFIVQPRYGYMRGQSLVEWKVERVMAGDWIPPTPLDDCAAAVDLGIAAITEMRTAGRSESDRRRMVRWTAIAQQLLRDSDVRTGRDRGPHPIVDEPHAARLERDCDLGLNALIVCRIHCGSAP